MELELKLNSPITEEQMDTILDVDFDHTTRVWFHTKHGKEVEFVKQKTGRWDDYTCMNWHGWHCSECDYETQNRTNYCPNCGARMLKE